MFPSPSSSSSPLSHSLTLSFSLSLGCFFPPLPQARGGGEEGVGGGTGASSSSRRDTHRPRAGMGREESEQQERNCGRQTSPTLHPPPPPLSSSSEHHQPIQRARATRAYARAVRAPGFSIHINNLQVPGSPQSFQELRVVSADASQRCQARSNAGTKGPLSPASHLSPATPPHPRLGGGDHYRGSACAFLLTLE